MKPSNNGSSCIQIYSQGIQRLNINTRHRSFRDIAIHGYGHRDSLISCVWSSFNFLQSINLQHRECKAYNILIHYEWTAVHGIFLFKFNWTLRNQYLYATQKYWQRTYYWHDIQFFEAKTVTLTEASWFLFPVPACFTLINVLKLQPTVVSARTIAGIDFCYRNVHHSNKVTDTRKYPDYGIFTSVGNCVAFRSFKSHLIFFCFDTENDDSKYNFFFCYDQRVTFRVLMFITYSLKCISK